MNENISVIIPCYNQGLFIDEAVESVLAQSFKDYEILIINDGSTEESTINKLSDYSKPKTRVISTENRGLSAARNLGVRESRGEFIQFLDADDIILSTKFEEQYSILKQRPEIDISFSDYSILDIDKKTYIDNPTSGFNVNEPISEFLFRWERGWNIPIHCGLFRKNIWHDQSPFNEKLRAKEDWVMWCTLAVRNKQFNFLDKKYAIYRYHNSNMTKNSMEMNYAFMLATHYILQIIPEKYKDEFLKEAIVHVNNSLQNSLCPELNNQIEDLKRRFFDLDKTIDYRLGNLILRPYRTFKSKFLSKKYL